MPERERQKRLETNLARSRLELAVFLPREFLHKWCDSDATGNQMLADVIHLHEATNGKKKGQSVLSLIETLKKFGINGGEVLSDDDEGSQQAQGAENNENDLLSRDKFDIQHRNSRQSSVNIGGALDVTPSPPLSSVEGEDPNIMKHDPNGPAHTRRENIDSDHIGRLAAHNMIAN